MPVTFKVHDVKQAERPKSPVSATAEAMWKDRLDTTPEAWSEHADLQASDVHPLLHAVSSAWGQHIPLILSPDMIWTTIAQGLATHIEENAEQLRHHFVEHEGKIELAVRRDGFLKGSRDNDWPGVFSEFSDLIKPHIKKKHDLLVSNFSTTGPLERACSEITLMDAMKAYFSYTVRTCCGFPLITLEGTRDDWRNILGRAQALAEFGLEWWTPSLVDVLESMLTAFDGKVLQTFWGSMYASGGGSGGPFVGGWINAFFPYLGQGRGRHKNPLLRKASPNGWKYSSNSFDDYPSGMSVAPFEWQYYGQAFPMDFVGGLLGVEWREDGLRPAFGWCIRDRKVEPSGSTGLKAREEAQEKQEKEIEEWHAKNPGGVYGRVFANTRAVARAIRAKGQEVADKAEAIVRGAFGTDQPNMPRPTGRLPTTPAWSFSEAPGLMVANVNPANPGPWKTYHQKLDPVPVPWLIGGDYAQLEQRIMGSVREMDEGVVEERLKVSKVAHGKSELQVDLAAYNAVDAKAGACPICGGGWTCTCPRP